MSYQKISVKIWWYRKFVVLLPTQLINTDMNKFEERAKRLVPPFTPAQPVLELCLQDLIIKAQEELLAEVYEYLINEFCEDVHYRDTFKKQLYRQIKGK